MADQPAAPAPGTPEYDAAMAAKAKEAGVGVTDHDVDPPEGDQGQKPQRPENIPEKFWDAEKGVVNVEALAKSYTELEKARSAPPKEPTAEEKAAAEAAAKDVKAGEAAGDALRAKAEQEWAANETLSEDTYKAYEKAGVTREQINVYIEGQKALAEVRKNEAYSVVGGEEQYKAMQAWAAANLTEAEQAAYDRDVLGSPDKGVRTNAIRGLAARYTQAEGSDGKMIVPNNEGKPANEGFKSKAEMMAAMSDPKYKTSPAFRAEVAQKIAAASKAGVYLGVS